VAADFTHHIADAGGGDLKRWAFHDRSSESDVDWRAVGPD